MITVLPMAFAAVLYLNFPADNTLILLAFYYCIQVFERIKEGEDKLRYHPFVFYIFLIMSAMYLAFVAAYWLRMDIGLSYEPAKIEGTRLMVGIASAVYILLTGIALMENNKRSRKAFWNQFRRKL